MHNFEITSHVGNYKVVFSELINQNEIKNLGTHFIIDRNLSDHLSWDNFKNLVLIDSNEQTKSYQNIESIIIQLLKQGLKRDSILVAIGGGITQDITCFIATTFMRGIKWVFVPTTVLSQADSCIGSKSSINLGSYKNLLGSFNPPSQVIICSQFLSTLEDKDISSGIGEILKLFIINKEFINSDNISRENIVDYIYKALKIKQKYIEIDEFDKGPRQILNYGHCIGHAIESATNFVIPHGIAITIGMDVVNKLSLFNNDISHEQYQLMYNCLKNNYRNYIDVRINKNKIFDALLHDKKNTGNKINLILPVNLEIVKKGFDNTEYFRKNLTIAMNQILTNLD